MSPDARTQYPAFPGAVGISRLAVYQWESADGQHGGAPHLHLACAECYVVVSGHGRLETLTMTSHTETELASGDVVWFEPGTIHRAINDGELVAVVVMQNGGLPEAGDAVMTFPPEHLTDSDAYAVKADLGTGPEREARALARRDLALTGFQQLATSFDAGDTAPVEAFYRAAANLVMPKLDEWRQVVADGPAAEVARSIARIDNLGASRVDYMINAAAVARISRPEDSLGMCGRLNAYDAVRRVAHRNG